jgi:hypothetical protein
MRRIGVLASGDGNDPLEKAQISAFTPSACPLGLDRWPQRADRLSRQERPALAATFKVLVLVVS